MKIKYFRNQQKQRMDRREKVGIRLLPTKKEKLLLIYPHWEYTRLLREMNLTILISEVSTKDKFLTLFVQIRFCHT